MRNVPNKILWLTATAFAVVLLLVHRNWVFTLSPLISSDWPYFDLGLMQSWAPIHPFWINFDSLGRAITQGNFISLFTAYSWLAHLSLPFEVVSRLLFF